MATRQGMAGIAAFLTTATTVGLGFLGGRAAEAQTPQDVPAISSRQEEVKEAKTFLEQASKIQQDALKQEKSEAYLEDIIGKTIKDNLELLRTGNTPTERMMNYQKVADKIAPYILALGVISHEPKRSSGDVMLAVGNDYFTECRNKTRAVSFDVISAIMGQKKDGAKTFEPSSYFHLETLPSKFVDPGPFLSKLYNIGTKAVSDFDVAQKPASAPAAPKPPTP